MNEFLRSFAFAVICYAEFLVGAQSQTATVIPANEAAAHVGEYATVEGVVAKVITSKNGNTFLNMGAAYPNQFVHGVDTDRITDLKISHAVEHRRKARQNNRPNRDVQREAGDSDQCRRTAGS